LEAFGMRALPNVSISERQEEVLSYLCGLAPLGETFQVKHRWLATDFGRMHHSNFYQLVKKLVKKGAVEIIAKGIGSSPSFLRVLKRPEAFTVSSGWRLSA